MILISSGVSLGRIKIAQMYRFGLLAALWATSQLVPAAAEPNEDFLHLSTQVALDSHAADFGVDWDLFNSEIYLDWQRKQAQVLLRILPSTSPLRNRNALADLLGTVYYESLRAGVDPDWVLAIMQVESAFRKHAISTVGARGYMQVMPFWIENIGNADHNLFNLRTNIRYGTVILRHYIDIEKGNLFRALGRYNGSLGRAHYPELVLRAYERNWQHNRQAG